MEVITAAVKLNLLFIIWKSRHVGLFLFPDLGFLISAALSKKSAISNIDIPENANGSCQARTIALRQQRLKK